MTRINGRQRGRKAREIFIEKCRESGFTYDDIDKLSGERFSVLINKETNKKYLVFVQYGTYIDSKALTFYGLDIKKYEAFSEEIKNLEFLSGLYVVFIMGYSGENDDEIEDKIDFFILPRELMGEIVKNASKDKVEYKLHLEAGKMFRFREDLLKRDLRQYQNNFSMLK